MLPPLSRLKAQAVLYLTGHRARAVWTMIPKVDVMKQVKRLVPLPGATSSVVGQPPNSQTEENHGHSEDTEKENPDAPSEVPADAATEQPSSKPLTSETVAAPPPSPGRPPVPSEPKTASETAYPSPNNVAETDKRSGQVSGSITAPAPDSTPKEEVDAVPPPPPKTRIPRRNMVLPIYEPPLPADDTVKTEPARQKLLDTAMRYVNHFLYNKRERRRERPASVLERLTSRPQNIKCIAVIGVHGWFPNRILQRGMLMSLFEIENCQLIYYYLRAVVGEPTGTSTRFAAKMGAALRNFFQMRYNVQLPTDAITLIPLEGEGKVEQRVEILYQNLVNSDLDWVTKLREADLVFVVTHSQGTPVSTILLARLIEEGLVDVSRQKIGFLAMAGITHGPFPSLKSSIILKYVEADPARELFDFNDAESAISRRYQAAMRKVLGAGVRMIAIGSWYDQVVPLYSGIMHGYNHPNIYRALYIDGADYQPDFLSHLVVYALKLRNAGLSDHDLVVHLSEPLAGNVYGFGTQGHSVIYEELSTYMLAIAWTLGRNPVWTLAPGSDAQEAVGVLDVRDFDAPTRLNPYHLPFIMGELFHSNQLKRDPKFYAELKGLVAMYKLWDPSSKALKDLRYRLDFMKSKL
ncbi:hypothetical protein HDV00_003466 [Rhizophlyctis rosea]|nr:hypothetical protein HDV00_003466 [Rhizophlyctis rosea]